MADAYRASIPGAVRFGGKSKSELLHALREHDVALNKAAEALFDDHRFTTLGRWEEIEIATVSVSDLGFADGARYDQLITRAYDFGLVECPLEAGPHLRIQFLNQLEGAFGIPATHGQAPPGSITVASPPLDDSDETPKGFYLRRADGVLWLRGYWSWPGHVWSPQDALVFSTRVSR